MGSRAGEPALNRVLATRVLTTPSLPFPTPLLTCWLRPSFAPVATAAVATETATHQLVAATATLALCARPLLLAGYAQPPAAPQPTGAGEAAGEAAAAGEGADERETAAQVRRLLACFLCILPSLPVHVLSPPLGSDAPAVHTA